MDCLEPTRKKEKLLMDETNETLNNAKINKENNGILSKEHILNFPIPIDNGKACIVKVNYFLFLHFFLEENYTLLFHLQIMSSSFFFFNYYLFSGLR